MWHLDGANKGFATMAVAFALVGAVVYAVTNSAFPMLTLSNQYASATTDAQRSVLLAAGQAALASGYNPGALYQSAGFYLSLMFMALATLIMSVVMLRSNFGKITGYVGDFGECP